MTSPIDVVERDRPAGVIRSALAAGAVLLSVAIVDWIIGPHASDRDPIDRGAIDALKDWVRSRGLEDEVGRASRRLVSIIADGLWQPMGDSDRN